MKAGYLTESRHHMLPASWRYPQTANTISHRGPGQHLEFTTGEPATAIGRQGSGNDAVAAVPGSGSASAAGQPGAGLVVAFIRLRACAYARDRSVPGPARDIIVRRPRSGHDLGPRWDGQA